MQLLKVLVAAVQGVGILHVRGEYTQIVYEIPPQGVLVHPYDVDGIIQQQKTFCCAHGEPARQIYPFFVGKATADQVAYVEVPDPEPVVARASILTDPEAADAEAATRKGRKTKPAPPPPEPDDAVVWDEGEPAKSDGGTKSRETPLGG
jgi:hypothetical protein